MICARLLGFLFINSAMGVALPAPNQPAEAPEIAIVRSPYEPFLDDFEQTGLAQLVKGEELVAISTDHWFRGMGAIRANASRLECHTQAQEGDLLGAFSYFGVVKVLNVMDAMESRGLRSSLNKLIQERASPERYWVSLGTRPKVTDHEKRWFGSPEAQLHRSIAIQGLISPEMLQTLQRDRQAAMKHPRIFKNEPNNPLGYKGGYPRVE